MSPLNNNCPRKLAAHAKMCSENIVATASDQRYICIYEKLQFNPLVWGFLTLIIISFFHIEYTLMPAHYIPLNCNHRCVRNATTTGAAKSATIATCWCITTGHISPCFSTGDSTYHIVADVGPCCWRRTYLDVCVFKQKYSWACVIISLLFVRSPANTVR